MHRKQSKCVASKRELCTVQHQIEIGIQFQNGYCLSQLKTNNTLIVSRKKKNALTEYHIESQAIYKHPKDFFVKFNQWLHFYLYYNRFVWDDLVCWFLTFSFGGSVDRSKTKMAAGNATATFSFLDSLKWMNCTFCLKEFSRNDLFMVLSCTTIACIDCAKPSKYSIGLCWKWIISSNNYNFENVFVSSAYKWVWQTQLHSLQENG